MALAYISTTISEAGVTGMLRAAREPSSAKYNSLRRVAGAKTVVVKPDSTEPGERAIGWDPGLP